MIESSITIFNDKIIDFSRGTPTSVEFNFERIWKYSKNTSLCSDLYHFYHVHPTDSLFLSETDKNCMKGLRLAFGMDINFYVITFLASEIDMFNTYYKMIWFTQQKEGYVEIEEDAKRRLLHNELLFLKYLSYGEMK